MGSPCGWCSRDGCRPDECVIPNDDVTVVSGFYGGGMPTMMCGGSGN